MPELIVAMDKKGGIGLNGKLPWNNKEELNIFRKKTMGKAIIVGRKTWENLPKLDGRDVYFLSNQPLLSAIHSLYDTGRSDEDIMIAGGRKIYKHALEIPGYITRIHISIMNNEYECDTYFDKKWLDNFVIVNEFSGYDFVHYVLEPTCHGERQYIDILKELVNKNEWKLGRNGLTCSLFKKDMIFDLRNGFPLLTTKKMFFRGIVAELIMFLNGRTDTNELTNNGINIWKGNTTKEFLKSQNLDYAEGVMGPLYGYQFRSFNAPYNVNENGKPIHPNGGIDQLANIIKLIKEDPNSRRILMTSYNPEQAEKGVLYPCHSITLQFYVEDDYIDMFCYNRSNDWFLGNPFNIASSSLLLMIIAKLTDKTPRFFYLTSGDTHLYKEHVNAAAEIIDRIPYKFPIVEFPDIKSLNDLCNLHYSDFKLYNYRTHPTIKVPMIV